MLTEWVVCRLFEGGEPSLRVHYMSYTFVSKTIFIMTLCMHIHLFVVVADG